MSVFRFVRQIVEGETVVIHGDGSQSRDFTFRRRHRGGYGGGAENARLQDD